MTAASTPPALHGASRAGRRATALGAGVVLAVPGAAGAQAAEPATSAPARLWAAAAFDTVARGPGGNARLTLRDGVLRVAGAPDGWGAPRALSLPLAALAGADSAVRARVLDARRGRDGATLYVVALVLGARRGGPPWPAGGGAPAGPGTPPCAPMVDLVWLAVADGTLVAGRSARVQDCLDLVRTVAAPDVSAPPAFRSDVLALDYELGPARDGAWPRRRVTYDRRRPARGLGGDVGRP